MSVDELAQAVTLQEAGRLIKVPGIGKKTADACCSNSRASWAPTWRSAVERRHDAQADILQALVALGYSDRRRRPR